MHLELERKPTALRAGILAALCFFVFIKTAGATPTDTIGIPSTDILERGSGQLKIESNISESPQERHNAPSELGLEYGVARKWEAGADLNGAGSKSVNLNFKYGVEEKKRLPAFAIGAYAIGIGRKAQNKLNYEMWYAVAGKTIPRFARVTAGGYYGTSNLINDVDNQQNKTGLLLSLDRQFTEKLWAAADYLSGNNLYGAKGVGVSYDITRSNSLCLSYMFYNAKQIADRKKDVFSAQIEINY